MHSFWIRANAVLFFGLGALALLATLNVLSTSLVKELPPVVKTFEVHELRRLSPFRGSDRAVLTFSLDVDMTPVWTWNTRQIFLFVMADYRGTKHIRNGVVLFDAIITEKDMGRISGQDFIKYPLEDSVDDLRDVSITLRLGYDVHPLFGPLSLHGTGRKLIPELPKHKITYNYSFPTVYT